MKNFTKFLVVVIALVAYGCTTDTTEDLAVRADGQTTLTLSLEESRTQLGEEVAGLYPVTWSEGDVISVNGVPSSAIAIESSKKAATFTFNSTLSYPYAVAYPAANEGKVIFAAEQTHTESTFANGAAAMYGYKTTESGALTLSHLTGVLKIGVCGSAVLSHAQISTIDRTPIAGEFALNFATGELTPTANSEYTINYTFEESADGDAGLALSDAPIYLHLAVPAGVYNELYVTLYDADGGVMYATVKANDEKPLVAGNVRKFSSNINYKASESVFVIKDYASLKAFAEQIGTLTEDAVFVNDVVVPEEEPWVSIDNKTYTKTVRGNGYAIKGLTKPLFDTTAASFKGLHLKDVKIVETTVPTIGALARFIDNTAAVVENCSAVGSITINATNVAEPAAPTTSYAWMGGLVGRTTTQQAFSGLYTDVDIYTDGYIPYKVAMGGCFGSSDGGIHNSTNHGTLTYNGSNGFNGCTVYAGGVCFECKEMINCVNGSKDDKTGATGAIDVGGVVGGALAIGGLADLNKGEITNCHNYGNLTASAHQIGNPSMFIGGLIRMSNQHAEVISNCSNHGNILVKNITTPASTYIKLGGLVSKDNYGAEFINCSNYGNITTDSTCNCNFVDAGGFTSTVEYNNEVANYYFRFTNCNNYGNISVDGTYTERIYIGGLLAVIVKKGIFECTNCHNHGALKFLGDSSMECAIGGLLGRSYSENTPFFTNCTNNGSITADANATVAAESYFGGLVALLYGTANTYEGTVKLNNCSNLADGDIEVAMKSDVKVNIGGIIGSIANHGRLGYSGNLINRGDLTANGEYKELGLGGIFGFFLNQFGSVTDNLDTINYGKITFSGKTSGGRLLVGGILGASDTNMNAKGGINFINLGDIECTGTYDTTKTCYVGGVVGLLAASAKIHYSQCFCNIKAPGYPNVGMVSGTPRTVNATSGALTLGFTNCKAGGTITKTVSYEEDPSGNGDQITVYYPITITSDNYFEHAYGAVETKDNVDGDVFTLLTSADQITYRSTAQTE